jgi:hypothetical protein
MSPRAFHDEMRKVGDRAMKESLLSDGGVNLRRGVRSARERTHQVLTLLGVPTAPKLIRAVHDAFFSGELLPSQLSSLRRHDERSYRSLPNARPYYLCPALATDRLSPARALLTVSTWPLHRRVVGPLSPRVDFLYAAVRVADIVITLAHPREHTYEGASQSATERLLWRFAVKIPGALAVGPAAPVTRENTDVLDPWLVRRAARAELDVHANADRLSRAELAQRAREQLTDMERLFGRR